MYKSLFFTIVLFEAVLFIPRRVHLLVSDAEIPRVGRTAFSSFRHDGVLRPQEPAAPSHIPDAHPNNDQGNSVGFAASTADAVSVSAVSEAIAPSTAPTASGTPAASPSNEDIVKGAVALLASTPTRSDPSGGEDFVVYDYKPTTTDPKSSHITPAGISSALLPGGDSPAYNASVRIAFFDGGQTEPGGTSRQDAIDFIATADPSDIAYSENGIIHLRRSLHGGSGLISGLFDAKDRVRTRMDIPLVKDEDIALEVPLMGQSSFYRFLDENEITDYGGFILVDMIDESIEDVDVDTGYEKKIFLNSRLDPVEPEMDYRFTLFLSVHPGNTTLTYLTGQGEAVKTVHIHPDEIFFESPSISQAHRREFFIQEQPLLALGPLPVTLNARHIRYLGVTEPSFMEAHGLYRIAVPPTLRAMREYLSVGSPHQEFIASHNGDTVTVPGGKRFDAYRDYLDLEDTQACVAQFEFGKIPLGISIHSSSIKGPMVFDDYYMAYDGNIYESFGDFTKTMFLVSGDRGVFNLKVSYEDDTVDYLQTFCNHSLYIVENL